MENSDDIKKLVIQAMAQRGGKPTKYVQLDKYSEIEKLIAADVQLPFILKWLQDEKKEILVLNTLRKYVIFKIGREGYDEYLKRNGWLKKKRTIKSAVPELATSVLPVATPKSAIEKSNVEKKIGQNPLRALSGTPKDENHIPKAKFELD